MIIVAFIVFSLGGGFGAALATRITRMASAAFLALLAAVSFDLLAWRMPFVSVSIETLVTLAGVIAMGFVFALFFRVLKNFDPRSTNRRPGLVVIGTLLYTMLLLEVSVMIPLIERQRFAQEVILRRRLTKERLRRRRRRRGYNSATPAINLSTFSCVACSRESSPTSFPSRITSTRVDIASTSGSSEEMSIIATPCWAS